MKNNSNTKKCKPTGLLQLLREVSPTPFIFTRQHALQQKLNQQPQSDSSLPPEIQHSNEKQNDIKTGIPNKAFTDLGEWLYKEATRKNTASQAKRTTPNLKIKENHFTLNNCASKKNSHTPPTDPQEDDNTWELL